MPPIPQTTLLSRLLPYFEEKGHLFLKKINILAKEALGGEEVQTITSDGLETVNHAKKGDFLVKNKTGAGEIYIVSPDTFHKKYVFLHEAEDGFSEYRSTGKVIALELKASLLAELDLPSPFYFEAPWGEDMIAKEGDFLAMPPDKGQVYRIARKEFFETYGLEN